MRRAFAAELAASDGPGVGGWGLSARASVFFSVDQSWSADVMAPGCFAADLPEFLERGFVGGIGHNWECPIGRPTLAEERADGLYVEGTLSKTAHGEEARLLIQDGVLKFVSIGFRAVSRTWLDTLEEVGAWWEEVGYQPTTRDLTRAAYGCRRVDRAKLYEFSPVAVPACDDAAILGVKAGYFNDKEGEGSAAPGLALPLAQHSHAVLAAVEEWAERLESVNSLRNGEGRQLSPEHRAGLKRLTARIETVLNSRAVTRQFSDEAARLEAEFLAFEARLAGCQQ